MRLAGKAGIVVGAGQTPGKTVGTGRAAGLVLAREGAKVMLADRNLAPAQETAAMVTGRRPGRRLVRLPSFQKTMLGRNANRLERPGSGGRLDIRTRGHPTSAERR
jgi:NAD(P)-dependent dehydrogenase (short-subunit alcohol dehydrogenase family)